MADIRPLLRGGVPHVHVAVLAELHAGVRDQVIQGDLAASLLGQPHVVVAEDRVDTVTEPVAEGSEDSLQLPDIGHEGAAILVPPRVEPGVQRVLVGGNEVAREDDALDPIPHAGQERGLEHEVAEVWHFDVGDDDRVLGVDDLELVADG